MAKYLVDANLPYHFSLWHHQDYIHQTNIDDSWSDTQIWEYARLKHLTIITKDSDFFNLMLISDPPPKVIHLKVGNMSIKQLFNFLNDLWTDILILSESCKLVIVYPDRIEGLGNKLA